LALQPAYADAHSSLGSLALSTGHVAEAIRSYRQALELNPRLAEAHYGLGTALHEQGELDEAAACCRRALEVSPNDAKAYINLGNALIAQGNTSDATAAYRRAAELAPDDAAAHSNVLCTMYFSPEYDAKAILAEHVRWNDRFAKPLSALVEPHGNDRSPERRLRIGYFSLGFHEGSTTALLLPLLEAHDHEHFETFCYAGAGHEDATTARCRKSADAWRNTGGLSDADFAKTVRDDRIDILVDLTMHLAGGRLLAFARKPAPIQVTYLAYPGTTGLSAMDYRLTDPLLDPPAGDLSVYSEESVRLPQTYWCYRSPFGAPEVNGLPSARAGHVTFGCLNSFCKASRLTLDAWSDLLRALPDAKLLLYANAGEYRDSVRERFAAGRIAPERITFVGKVSQPEYLRIYHRVDIGLDPFPYGGGATTCDALWMGVPVVTLVGAAAVGRGGLSIMSNVGLKELAASDYEQYVRIAVELARDLPRLENMRLTMRERMSQSALMDAAGFARNVEAAYRAMWRRWCGGSLAWCEPS
jgi:predicted O-linked N-acetylglucosamine transferase (SPINDLY family)